MKDARKHDALLPGISAMPVSRQTPSWTFLTATSALCLAVVDANLIMQSYQMTHVNFPGLVHGGYLCVVRHRDA